MNLKSNPPVFLVGCPRSGTTLLQSMLAAHPEIASFRESKFFLYMVPEYEPRRRALGLVSRQLKRRLEKYFKDEIGRSEMLQRFPRIIFMSCYTRKFMNIMNFMTEEQGKSIFLEKTPDHIYKIEYIEKFVPGVRFIHLLRNGADVVASLYEVTNKYPKPWAGARTIDICIDYWVRAVESSRKYIYKPNHILVRYENLVENPRSVLKELCEFIGVEFNEKMLRDYGVIGTQLSLEHEGRVISQSIQNANSKKFYQLFDEAQRQYILGQLSVVNLDGLER
ncbi:MULTISPECIES: sulfotransferase family protein [unclassified Coleofasciculus]|uniref:sulfotransferase family protein n=1 Tax=unclassified Coleofasciculus TaxID=2692782 RepID=UPI001881D32D|nr:MULTISPECIES: sulfotransferase [unclassified Coleofasciculus]MBE9126711.1 sulfotransferase [Coleofasciculus sp. LEGE 07081]MBE9150071.1 sulfotransferase [Coleofasciculus sp. LEGE 07092]